MSESRKELQNEIVSSANRIATMIRSLPSTETPLKNSSWTIGSAVAHLIISQRLSKKILLGEKNPYQNAKPETVQWTNKKLLQDFTERKGDKLATILIMETESFLKTTIGKEDTFRFNTHFGSMDMLTGLSYNLCHLLIHGSQIALALKKNLPLNVHHIHMVLPFLKKAMIATYDKDSAKDFKATFAIHLRGLSSYAIVCDGETVDVLDEIPKDIDCYISADPVSYFLISTGITSQWKLFLQGKILMWGRKPWLALRLTTLFKSP